MANHNSGPRKEFVVGARIKVVYNPPGCEINLIGKTDIIREISCGKHEFFGAFPGGGGENDLIWFTCKHIRLI